MDTNNQLLHIAMLPWLAFGHLIPFLHLAKLLARKGHSISFISTHKNIKRLPKIPTNLTNKIHFIEFSLPSTPGLPPGSECTSELTYTHLPYLKLAFDGLRPQLATFLESSLPQWLILDFSPYWAIPIASKLGIRTAFFSIFNASSLAFVGPFMTLDDSDDVVEPDNRKDVLDWTIKPKWVPFESDVAFRYFEAAKMSDCLGENVTGVTDGQRMAAIMRNCDVIAPRGCYEFGPEWLTLLEDICKKPVLPVGLLPPTTIDEDLAFMSQSTKDWLDKWPLRSIVYVAFGTESTLTHEELSELALGLELSGLPFFWVLKTQVEDLPDGFQERIKERGVIWTSWAPQVKILSHDSIGGFLSHAGWASAIEAIILEKPLILFTLFSEQGLFAKVWAKKRLGYVIPREEKDGSFTRNSVADSLRMVVLGEEGKVYRQNVKEMSGVFGDMAKQQEYVDNFANYLQTHLQGN